MERRLTAILAADVAGYSRLMSRDEEGTLSALKAHRREMADARIAAHAGRIVKLTGDGMLVEFASVVNAVACAADIQRRMRQRNAGVPAERCLEFRIGIHLGDIIFDAADNDIYGEGVNIAARLEGLARPGGVAVSGTVRDSVGNRLDLVFEDAGEQMLKNIERPVRVYTVDVFAGAPPPAAADAPGRKAESANGKPSIAVLPFSNMSGDPEQDYFSDGIAEDIITDLSKISALHVVARHTAFTYKGKAVDVPAAAREMGVKFVLEGSVRKAGPRVRIAAQLIDGATGGHLWAERYDRDLTDIFAIQDEITRTIVDQLKVRLLSEEKTALGRAPTGNIEAYTTYLKAREFFRTRAKDSLQLARRLFSRAVDIDPAYARAYAGIADCDSILAAWHGASISLEALFATCAKALELDPHLAEAHASHGLALSTAGRPTEAVAAFERAIALDPNSYEGHYFYARHAFAAGDFEKAVALYSRCAEIDPDDYRAPFLITNALHALGRLDEEVAQARLGLERAERALKAHPENSDPAQHGAVALALLGEKERAREWLARALTIDPDSTFVRYNAACTYSLLGEADRAIDLLETCLRQSGSEEMKLWIKNDSDLDPLRNHPRYTDLLMLIA
ncbi:tetratricopeptide repeat protein [Nordella sp. HKS 07]|uniref:TPR end-of-group domain-containing protein n=1 Tax=Nordella sp. HKS 07 TaxID=2712222 RepID=UPI0013E15C84|nr:tetratricopeptide repeat protein [Nordella sp. HKS 07]QIG48953.1 tetratricopeptide repeat protein [Nordella sp. HKS 07]